jgi:hypothetical protein
MCQRARRFKEVLNGISRHEKVIIEAKISMTRFNSILEIMN